MSELVANCPRCNSAKMTFDVKSVLHIGTKYGWQLWYEAFSICRHCDRSTVFILTSSSVDASHELQRHGLTQISGAVNNYVNIEGFINLKDTSAVKPPEHLPKNIEESFKEGATCLATECFNAAATMFRLCIDLATRPMLPKIDEKGLNSQIRRNLGLRLPWLFDNDLLPISLKELSTCVKEDGNDGAHAGTLKKADAEDLLEFTHAFLERLYTEPEKLRLAKERRDVRRKPK
jgi:hypothetical protein